MYVENVIHTMNIQTRITLRAMIRHVSMIDCNLQQTKIGEFRDALMSLTHKTIVLRVRGLKPYVRWKRRSWSMR